MKSPYKLSAYHRLHMRLRPKIDHDLVGDLLAIIEEGGGASARKARARLAQEIEEARLERDLTLSVSLRRAVRCWESQFVDGEQPPACFQWDQQILDELEFHDDAPSTAYLRTM